MSLTHKYFPALDYGFVSLVDHMGSDSDIVDAARVSYGKGTSQKRNDEQLIRYLLRHKHTSPFEQVELKFHIAMPIFVARQWIRHRTASLNEYSGRYSKMSNSYYAPSSDRITAQSKDNKQGSSDERVSNVHDFHFKTYPDTAFCEYEDMIDMGVSRELSRVILPLSTYTEMYWKIDLHNLFHFLKLRLDSHAQWEIREYAQIIAGICKELFPLSFKAFLDYSYNSVMFSDQEMKILLGILRNRCKPINTLLNIDPTYNKLSGREQREFVFKLKHKSRTIRSLDVSSALSSDEARMRLHGND